MYSLNCKSLWIKAYTKCINVNVNTLYNLFEHSFCTILLSLLFIKSTVYCPAHVFIFYSFFHTYIYVYFLFFVFVFHNNHCPWRGPNLHLTTGYIFTI